ncbi:hypothetical protein GCM10025777_14990 [Membranihabitans marinus]
MHTVDSSYKKLTVLNNNSIIDSQVDLNPKLAYQIEIERDQNLKRLGLTIMENFIWHALDCIEKRIVIILKWIDKNPQIHPLTPASGGHLMSFAYG